MTCPFLDYRADADEGGSADLAFDEPRAYCTAAERFVQPMRADVCNDRYELRHDEHCEIYLAHADGADGAGETDDEEDGDDVR